MDTSNHKMEEFIAKVDAFAATLEPEEQAMFVDLLVGDDGDVSGFAAGWPGLVNLGVGGNGIGGNPDGFMETGGGNPKVFKTEPDYTGFMESGGGSPKV